MFMNFDNECGILCFSYFKGKYLMAYNHNTQCVLVMQMLKDIPDGVMCFRAAPQSG